MPVTVVGKLAFFPEPQVLGWPVRVKKGLSGRRRRAVRRGGSAGSTDWRHRRQRLSGRLASTTPDDRQATRSGAGRGCTASRAAEARPGRLEGRAAPPGAGGKPTRERSRTLGHGPEAAESESGGPGPRPSRPEWRRSRHAAGSRGAQRAAVAVTETHARSAGLYLETRRARRSLTDSDSRPRPSLSRQHEGSSLSRNVS